MAEDLYEVPELTKHEDLGQVTFSSHKVKDVNFGARSETSREVKPVSTAAAIRQSGEYIPSESGIRAAQSTVDAAARARAKANRAKLMNGPE